MNMKMRGKISAIFMLVLCFALIFSSFSVVQAVAAAIITVDSKSANAGESVTLTVSGSYQYEIAHATFTVTYDSSVLTLSSHTTPNLGQSGAYSSVNTSTAGKVVYAFAHPTSTATSGDFLTLTFVVSKTATKGNTVVTISSNEIGNNVYPHTGDVVAGGVTVATPAADVDALIDAIGTVTTSSKSKIDTARTSYNALSDTQKGFVTKLSVLEAAEKKYTELTTNFTITYKVDGTGGSISSTSETVSASTGTITGSTATANEGYIFDGWYDENGNKVSSDATFVPTSKTTATYTAKFSRVLVYGDLDGDYAVDISDALFVLQVAIGKTNNITDDQNISGDVDGDGVITINDALLVLHKSVGKIDKFPIEN